MYMQELHAVEEVRKVEAEKVKGSLDQKADDASARNKELEDELISVPPPFLSCFRLSLKSNLQLGERSTRGFRCSEIGSRGTTSSCSKGKASILKLFLIPITNKY